LILSSEFCIQNTEFNALAMSSLRRIESTPDLTEQVYRRLLDAIGSGELAPGTRLTQEELAASLNVSRQPVLQALRLLKKDGVAIDVGRRGLIVAPLDPRLLGQLYDVRSVLDGLAAREAALAGAKIDPSVIDRGRKAIASGRVAAMLEADMAFHNAIYAASGNPLIAETAGRYWHHIRRAMGAVLQAAGVRESVWEEHQAIVDAINAGNAEEAERSARRHCEVGGRTLAARLDERVRAAS
jgi:DNA-binding GntR family transcriptional regulator